MKKRELEDIRKKDSAELIKMVAEKKQERNMILARMSVGREENVKKAAKLKTDIAQILTIKKEQIQKNEDTNR